MPYKIKITQENDAYYATYNNIKHNMEETYCVRYTEFIKADNTILCIYFHTRFPSDPDFCYCELRRPDGSYTYVRSSVRLY
jgi:hypothetical protein